MAEQVGLDRCDVARLENGHVAAQLERLVTPLATLGARITVSKEDW